MAMSENTVKVLNYCKDHANEDFTAAQAAEALGLDRKVVDGCFTAGIQRKDLGFREEGPTVDGKVIKYLKLTDAGMSFVADED